MRYKVAIHVTDEGYSVSVPGLPGCWSEGDTEEEALENIRDAIQEYVAALGDRTQDAEIREIEVAVFAGVIEMFYGIAGLAALAFVLPMFIRERRRAGAFSLVLMAVATVMYSEYGSHAPPHIDALPVASGEIIFLCELLVLGWLRVAILAAVVIIKSIINR